MKVSDMGIAVFIGDGEADLSDCRSLPQRRRERTKMPMYQERFEG